MLKQGLAEDRTRALTTFFAMAFGRFVIAFNKFSRWEAAVQRTKGAIGDRQALKMVYDFSEINALAKTEGCLSFALERESFCIRELAKIQRPCVVDRGNAEKLFYDDETFDAVITDPPYYSNESTMQSCRPTFYVWLQPDRLRPRLPRALCLSASPPKRLECRGAALRSTSSEERESQGAL